MLVRKGNKRLNVDEKNKDFYLQSGYSIIDGDGNVLEFSNTNEKELLKQVTAERDSLKKELEAMADFEKEVKTLKAKIKQMEAVNK